MAGVVFDAFAVADFRQHFEVKAGALFQALGFDQLVHADQLFQALGKFYLDGFDRCQHAVARRDIVARGVNGEARDFLTDAACERIKELQTLDFVVEQFDAYGQLRMLGGKHIDGVAPHAKFAARKILIVALVLHAHQLGDGVALADFVASAHRHHHAVVALGLTNTVDG